jgi:hypothetical protein
VSLMIDEAVWDQRASVLGLYSPVEQEFQADQAGVVFCVVWVGGVIQ